jgi:hypothetical protein
MSTPVATFTQLNTNGLSCTKNASCTVPVNTVIVSAPGVLIGSSGTSANGFVAQLDPTGAKVPFATYFGGSSGDSLNAIAVDSTGNFSAAGNSSSSDLSLSKGWQTKYNKGKDATVVKYSAK